MIYDVAILGGGVAGLSAGIYSSRYNLSTIIIAKVLGGISLESHSMENYPGFLSITGAELSKKFRQQAEKFGSEFLQGEITDVIKKGREFEILIKDKKSIKARALIIALGTEKRKLGIKNEKKYLGRGLSYCALCDGFMFKDKDVAVVGGGDSALHAALLLSEFAKSVRIICRKDKLRAQPKLIKDIKDKKIEIFYNSIVTGFLGKDRIKGIKINKKGKIEKLDVEGIFIEIGQSPHTVIPEKIRLSLDNDGYIKVDNAMKTNKKGIFAAGDITTGSNKLRQVITGAAEGAIAATSAYNLLKE